MFPEFVFWLFTLDTTKIVNNNLFKPLDTWKLIKLNQQFVLNNCRLKVDTEYRLLTSNVNEIDFYNWKVKYFFRQFFNENQFIFNCLLWRIVFNFAIVFLRFILSKVFAKLSAVYFMQFHKISCLWIGLSLVRVSIVLLLVFFIPFVTFARP